MRVDLGEEDVKKLFHAVNSGAEPPPELAGKLFPSLMEKMGQEGNSDFETLNRIRKDGAGEHRRYRLSDNVFGKAAGKG